MVGRGYEGGDHGFRSAGGAMTRFDLGEGGDLARLRRRLASCDPEGVLRAYEVERIHAARIGAPVGARIFVDTALNLVDGERDQLEELLLVALNASDDAKAQRAFADLRALLKRARGRGR